MPWRWQHTLSTLDVVTYLVLVVFAIAYAYVAYTAIAISRALSNRVYRNQALGVAAVSIIIVELSLWSVFGPNYVVTGIADAVQLLGVWFAFFIGFYYYIDASIGAARPTDPLFRDTFHWTRVRLALWAYIVGAAIVFSLAAAVDKYNYGTGGTTPAFFQAGIPTLIVIFSGAVVLPIAISRSKDKVLRRQLSWFATYMIWLILLVVGPFFISNAPNVAVLVVFLVGAYPLYRSATSLVPLYEFSKEPGKSG